MIVLWGTPDFIRRMLKILHRSARTSPGYDRSGPPIRLSRTFSTTPTDQVSVGVCRQVLRSLGKVPFDQRAAVIG